MALNYTNVVALKKTMRTIKTSAEIDICQEHENTKMH
uniref:Uncharacterized protein n=1 Tax=Rhizophora mucronata TaxID=61149 RepID=A0A2P2QJS4_RHIMU